jgi:hypothetical protein
MYIYNITTKVANSIVEQWVQWQQQENIPEVMSIGLFKEFRFFRLLEQDDSEGATFVIQYFTDDLFKYSRYVEEHAPRIRAKAFNRWGDKFIAFRTIMKTVH